VRRTAPLLSRRALFLGSALACPCCILHPEEASALAALAKPSGANDFDLPRDKVRDSGFAYGMANSMAEYERAVAPRKKELFSKLLASLPETDAVVVELGMGSFPNAEYFSATDAASPRQMDIIGVDPNDSMAAYATRSARRAGLLEQGHSVRVVHGVGEALPLKDRMADAVVCTLTLCSVIDPERVLSEVRRVLKRGGKLLFLEHVLSETDTFLAKQQEMATPMQVAAADGCHLNRRTLKTIEEAGFVSVDAAYTELSGFYFLNPTASGIATA
jgi:ubiquinone/menaquinone biosynthesis C-methylase UbiE